METTTRTPGAVTETLRACVLSRSDVCVRLLATPWTVAGQAPLSMAVSRQEHWSGLPRPPQGIFPTQVDSLPPEPPGKPNCDPTQPNN